MISPTLFSRFDASLALFVVLLACTAATLFCAFHFGDRQEVKQALITLRGRPSNLPPHYLLSSSDNEMPANIGSEAARDPLQVVSSNSVAIVIQAVIRSEPVSAIEASPAPGPNRR